MEGELTRLASNMDTISHMSSSINDSLQHRREQINKLAGSHMLLKKLQFLFELPTRLKQCVDMGAFAQV